MKTYILVYAGPYVRPEFPTEDLSKQTPTPRVGGTALVPVDDVKEIAPACCGYHFEVRMKDGTTHRRYRLEFITKEE